MADPRVRVKVVGVEKEDVRKRLTLLRPERDVDVIVDGVSGVMRVTSGTTRLRVNAGGSAFLSCSGRISEDAAAVASVLLSEIGADRKEIPRFLSAAVELGRTTPGGCELAAVLRGKDVTVKFRRDPKSGRYALKSRHGVLVRRTRSTCEVEILVTVTDLDRVVRKAGRIWGQLEDLAGGGDPEYVLLNVLDALGR
ncbi:hypothetical protein [Methanopyrus kandleri]|uniref:Uncharacterized protein n=1 Tax=Methanopyrus kandleri TaxID=2320 RepID=A0A832TBM7_9EURY|nr:hypothetical protein [Methanopyrus kandleri]HII69848.1 hypothetical protein [Methanopyrus kandleri]